MMEKKLIPLPSHTEKKTNRYTHQGKLFQACSVSSKDIKPGKLKYENKREGIFIQTA